MAHDTVTASPDLEWVDYRPDDPDEWARWVEAAPADGDNFDDVPDPPRLVAPADEWQTYGAEAVFEAAFPATRWICEALDIGPGRPCGFWGAPGAGKNDTVQALALAVMAGKPAFGRYDVTPGRVLHISYDMGMQSTALRYRRLANGMGLQPSDLRGRFEMCVHPGVNLRTEGAARKFAARLKGFDLCILDNAREAVPGVDENDSQFGSYLKIYGAAAERARCVPLYLHHTRKGGGTDVDAGRGSGAIVAASGCVWTVTADPSGARKLTHTRQHDMSDGVKDAFYLQRSELDGGAFDTGGRVSWRLEASDSIKDPTPGGKLGAAVVRVLRRSGPLSKSALRDKTGGRALPELDKALRALALSGKVRQTGEKWHL